MIRKLFVLGLIAGLATPAAFAGDVANAIDFIADGDHRSEAHKARNEYRNPGDTLEFFGIRPDMTVVEIAPGGAGWYTEILAPYLRENGKLYAGSYDPQSEAEYARRNYKRFNEKIAATPELYDKVEVTIFAPPKHLEAAPKGSADLIVTFRNFHGWLGGDNASTALEAMYAMLKPGGVLGIVQHRGDPEKAQDPEVRSGYVREDIVVKLAEKAGFELDARSEINANPKDTRDHPKGVWNLPPGFRDGDENREKYAAVGESDRMTLRFVKPAK